jgi:PAS domain S-box-containing protein
MSSSGLARLGGLAAVMADLLLLTTDIIDVYNIDAYRTAELNREYLTTGTHAFQSALRLVAFGLLLEGYDPGNVSGKDVFDFVHPDDLTRVREETERIISGGDSAGTKALEYRIRHKDGSWRWMEGGVAGVNDPAVRGVVLNARDITERKEAEERYRTLVEQIPVVAYIDRADGTDAPLYTSPQIEGLLGYNQYEGSRRTRKVKLGVVLTGFHPPEGGRSGTASSRVAAR